MTLLSGILIFVAGYLCGALVTRNAGLQARQKRIEDLRGSLLDRAVKPLPRPMARADRLN